MIRTHLSRRTGHLLVSVFALTAMQTTWAFAQTGFARGLQRRAVSLLWLLVCVAGLNAIPAFAQGIISTVAGSFSRGFSGDGGPGVSAQLNLRDFTGGVAADAAGNLYIADTGNHRIRKIDLGGIISTVAGNGTARFSGDGGPATSGSLFAPTGLGVDAAGNLYIVDTGNQRIRRVGQDGIITTVAGNGGRGFSGEGGMATSASLSLGNVQYLGIAGYPTSVAVDGAGNLYIADTDNGCVRKVNPAGIISTAVSGLSYPYGVAADTLSNLFVTDSSQVLRVTPSGVVSAIAGGLSSPSGVALDSAGNLYIADSHSHRIRKVEPNGITTIVAGSGDPIFDPIEGYYFVGGYSGDGGPATSAQLNFPWGVAVDAAGNIYIADSLNNRIRKVTAENIVPAQSTFTNPTSIADGFSTEPSPASPYPSDIAVSGLPGSVTKLTVTLVNLNFGSPRDADILLVGPNGQSVILMSDAHGDGTGHIINKTLTFDDAALLPLPSDGTLRSGAYRPTDHVDSGTDFFPTPAPVGPYGTSLSIFNGTNPNGKWSLYAVDDLPDNPFDDFGPDLEITGGWSLTVTTQGTPTPSPNPINDSNFFVRQNYLDFLNREPDQGGLDYWTNQITQCGNDARCIQERRIGVSAAFFVEQEFQETGYFVYRLQQASFGSRPTFTQFTADRAQVVGGSNVEAGKQALADAWVERAAFKNAYTVTMSPDEFVKKLFDTAGLRPFTAERQQLASDMRNGKSRARVLREVIEIAEFKQREYNAAFVLTQYFGYLRRDPDQGGYDFWLDVLNNRELNNYRGMVCAFLTSAEYQLRFGADVTRTNRDCAQ